jgi:ubiquinone/menaquinone biosynthesis C-methylase UbiE
MTPSIDNHRIKEDVKKAYDDIANKYLTWTEPSHKVRLTYLHTLLQNLDSTNSPNTKTTQTTILELGCGAGVPCTQLLASKPNFKITANDISESQIALAKQTLPDSVTLIQSDMMSLEFKNESFDAVLAMYSIIHLPRDEQITILQKIFGWLKPGGQILANFSEGEFDSSFDESWLGGEKGVMYWSGWGKEKMRGILADIGFAISVDEVVVDSEEVGGVEHDVAFQWVLARKEV